MRERREISKSRSRRITRGALRSKFARRGYAEGRKRFSAGWISSRSGNESSSRIRDSRRLAISSERESDRARDRRTARFYSVAGSHRPRYPSLRRAYHSYRRFTVVFILCTLHSLPLESLPSVDQHSIASRIVARVLLRFNFFRSAPGSSLRSFSPTLRSRFFLSARKTRSDLGFSPASLARPSLPYFLPLSRFPRSSHSRSLR